MSDKIFINYRREDSIGTAGRLRDRLAEAFGEESLFMDVDNIPAGDDFAADLNNQVTACRVFLAVIGPNWLDAKDESGVRRLDNPDDFVTIEIAAALARGDIRIIPVLVDNAPMPKADKLPESIKPLVRRNAVELRNSQFRRDAEMLVAIMRETLVPTRSAALDPEAAGPGKWRVPVVVAVAVALLLLIGGGYAFIQKREAAEMQQVVALKPEQERRAKEAAEAEAKRKAEEAEQQRVAAVKAKHEAATHAAQTTSAPPPQAAGEKIASASVPFISERARRELANEYVPKSAYKAFALNISGFIGYSLDQPSEDVAKIVALDQCSRRAENAQWPRKCELYAVGDTVVYPHPPPMPPAPWVRHDAATERPFVTKDMPLVRDQSRERLEKSYLSGRKSKSIALGPGGQFFYSSGSDSIEESTRRTLESCGALADVPCMIVTVDDVFVVTVPSLMNATGFFYAATSLSIAADERADLARKLNEASTGWNAVAVGTSGHPGLGLKAVSERDAINDALGNCAKRDSDCHVIAVGPFMVEWRH
jgi:adenylate cyclase